MTKTWDEVREEICKLYGEGRSLEYIRKTLQRQRHFEASTRAFRLKLKAWKIKRSDTAFAQDQAQVSNGEQSVICSSVRQNLSANTSALPSPEHLLLDDGVYSLSQLSRPTNQPTAQQDSAQHLGRSLEDLYLQISQVNFETSDRDLEKFLQPNDFVEGRTNILHFAVKEPASYINTDLIKHLLVYMQQHSIGVDMRDRQGRTALEIAVRSDSCSLASRLIYNGASAKQLDESAIYSTLHMALMTGASPSMFRLLLEHGADPNFYLPTSERSRAPLPLIKDILLSLRHGNSGYHVKWFEIAGLLVEYGAGQTFCGVHDIICSLVWYWSVSPESNQLSDKAEPLLKRYLREVSSLTDAMCLEAHNSADCESNTLVHAAVYHSRSPDLALLIMQLVNPKERLRSMICEILKPSFCNLRKASLANMGAILYSALRFNQTIDSYSDTFNTIGLLILALEHTPNRSVVEYVRAITSVMYNGIAISDHKERSHLVHLLVNRSPEVRYALAEVILEWKSYLYKFSPSGTVSEGFRALGFPYMMKRISHLPVGDKLVQDIGHEIRILLKGGSCEEEDFMRFVDCVLHVKTKDMVDEISPGNVEAKEMMLEIIRIRQLHKLPDLRIPQQLLYSCFCDQE